MQPGPVTLYVMKYAVKKDDAGTTDTHFNITKEDQTPDLLVSPCLRQTNVQSVTGEQHNESTCSFPVPPP